MHFVLFVLHDPDKLQALLAAWEEAGINGATVLYNTGLGRIRTNEGLREDIPLMPSLSDFFSHPEHHGRTIFTIVKDEALVEQLVAVTQLVVGDLSQPNTGLLVVLPASRVVGLEKAARKAD